MQDFHLFGLLAQGPRSFVYKARRRRTLSYVCVKRTPRAQQQGVANEVAIHALAGRHENVLTLYSWYITQRHLYRVIEFCAGGDLGTLITQDGGLPEAAVRLFGIDLLLGLLHCHFRGLLLCDGLRPSGVLLDENGSLRLSDFGYAQPYTDEIHPPLFIQSTSTMNRTAPELLHENESREVVGGDGMILLNSRSSDLWRLGVLLYELASGHTPFDAGPHGDNSPTSVRKRILTSDFPHVLVPVLPVVKKPRKSKILLSGILEQTDEERDGKEEDEVNIYEDNKEDDNEDEEDEEDIDEEEEDDGATTSKRVALASDVFQDLITKLLCKDPVKRIKWSELLLHPFWRANDSLCEGPPPELEVVLKSINDLPLEIHLERQRLPPPPPIPFNSALETSGMSLMSSLMGLGTNLTSSQLTNNSLNRSSSKMDEDDGDETAQISARIVRPHHPLPASISDEDEQNEFTEGINDTIHGSIKLQKLTNKQEKTTIDHSSSIIDHKLGGNVIFRDSSHTNSIASHSADIAPELLSLPVRYDPNNTDRINRVYGSQQQIQTQQQDENMSVSIKVGTDVALELQTDAISSNSMILSNPNAEDILSLLVFPGQHIITPIASGQYLVSNDDRSTTVLPFNCPGAGHFSQELASGNDANLKSHLSLLYRALIFADISTGRILSPLNAMSISEAFVNLQFAAILEVEDLSSFGSDSLVNVLVNSSISGAFAALSRYSIKDSIATVASSVLSRLIQRATNITSTLIFETGLFFSLADSLSDVLNLYHQKNSKSKGETLTIPSFRPQSPLSPSFHLVQSTEAPSRPLNSEIRKHIACAFGEVLFFVVSQSLSEKLLPTEINWRIPDWVPIFLEHHVLSKSEVDSSVRKVILHTLCNSLAHVSSISNQLCTEDLLTKSLVDLATCTIQDTETVNFAAYMCSLLLRSKWFAAASGDNNNARSRIDSLIPLANNSADSAFEFINALTNSIGHIKNENFLSASLMLVSLGLMSNSLTKNLLLDEKLIYNHTQTEIQNESTGAAFIVFSAAKASALVRFGYISEAAIVFENVLLTYITLWNKSSSFESRGGSSDATDREFEMQYFESCASLLAHTSAAIFFSSILKINSEDSSKDSENHLHLLKASVEIICATPSSLRILCMLGEGKATAFENLFSSNLSKTSPVVLQLSALACSLLNALDDSSCDEEAVALRSSIIRSVLPSVLYLLPTEWPVLPLLTSQFESAEDHAKAEAEAALVRQNLWPSFQLVYATLSQPFISILLHENKSSSKNNVSTFSSSFVEEIVIGARDALVPNAASLYLSIDKSIQASYGNSNEDVDEEERSALKVFKSSLLDIIRALVIALSDKGEGTSRNALAISVFSPTESLHALLSLCSGALLMPHIDLDEQTLQNDQNVCVDILAAAMKMAKKDWNWTWTMDALTVDNDIKTPTCIRLLLVALKSRHIDDRNSIRTAVDACSACLLRIAADLTNFQQQVQQHQHTTDTSTLLDQTFEGVSGGGTKTDLDETINSIKMLEAVVSGTGADVVFYSHTSLLQPFPTRISSVNPPISDAFLSVPPQAFDDPLDSESVYARDVKKAERLDLSLDALSSLFPFIVLLAADAHQKNDIGLLGSASSLLFLLCKCCPVKIAFHALFWTESSKQQCLETGLVTKAAASAFFQHAPPLYYLLDLVTAAALHLNKNASRISSHAELSLTLILQSCLSLTKASTDVLSASLRMQGESLLKALKSIESENADESSISAEEPKVPKIVRVRVNRKARNVDTSSKNKVNLGKGAVRSLALTAHSLALTLESTLRDP